MLTRQTSAPTTIRHANHTPAKMATTILAVLWTASLAVAQHSTGAQLSAGRTALPPSYSGMGSPQAQTGGQFFVEELQPLNVGYGFDINETTGEWIIKQPVFYLTTPLTQNTPYQGESFDFYHYLSQNSHYSTSQTTFSFSAAIGLLKASGGLSQSQSSSSTTTQTAFGLTLEQYYDPSFVDYANAASYVLTPLAQQIIQEPNPILKASRWKQAFGRFVAIGFDVYGSLGVKVAVSDMNSSKTHSKYMKMKLSYGPNSAQGSMGSASYEALTTQGLNLSWEYHGNQPLTGLSLPASVTELDTPQEQHTFVQGIIDAAHSARAKRGLFLIPAMSFPNGPQIGMPDWDGVLISNAALAARNAMDDLNVADGFNFPLSFRTFLDQQLIPNTSVSYTSQLDANRAQILSALADLWTKTKAYIANPNDSTTQNTLIAGIQTVSDARSAIGGTFSKLDELRDRLPVMTVHLNEWFTASGSDCATVSRAIQFEIDNVAAFTNPADYQSLYDWVTYHSGDEASICIREDRWCSGQLNLPHYAENLQPIGVIQETVYNSGPRKGLKHLFFECVMQASISSQIFRGEVLDDFGRSASYFLNANVQ